MISTEIKNLIEQNVKSISKRFDFIWKVYNLKEKETSLKIKKCLQWEIEALRTPLKDGKLMSIHTEVGLDGISKVNIPSNDKMATEKSIYYINRGKESTNPILRARYFQLVFNGKNNQVREDQAREAIDSYLSVLTLENYKNQSSLILDIIENSSELSIRSKNYKLKEIKELARKIIFSDNNKYSTYDKYRLITFMVKRSKIFKANDFTGILVECNLILDQFLISNDSYFGPSFADTADRIAKKLNLKTKHWLKRKGEILENFANYRLDDKSRIVPLHFLSLAISAYGDAGLIEKVNKLGVLYEKLSQELKLEKVPFSGADESLNDLYKYVDLKVDQILSFEDFQIFIYLSSGEGIFPKMEEIKKYSKKESLFWNSILKLRFDINKSVQVESEDQETSDLEKLFVQYTFYFRVYVTPFLHSLFINGVKQRKITFENLIFFLREYSWLGKDLKKRNQLGEIITYNWLSMIGPSLLDFFVQIESAILSESPYTNFILSLDSIVLKFEGILRDFAKKKGINTRIRTRNGRIREMYIEEIFAQEKFKESFHEDDIVYFKYIFTSNGLNLRNNIAHCYFDQNNYSIMNIIFVLVAILRLGKYNLAKE